jgi:hypothetical protein
VIVPSSAVETMNLGAISGLTALSQTKLEQITKTGIEN